MIILFQTPSKISWILRKLKVTTILSEGGKCYLEKPTMQSKCNNLKRREMVKAVSMTTADGGLWNDQHKVKGRTNIKTPEYYVRYHL